jgi:UDP-glucose 4-epimerase
VGDVADAFAAALAYDGPEAVFNIGSGQGHSLNDVLDRIEQLLGHPVARRYLPGRAIDVPVNVLATERARRELGWAPKVSLEAGLERTAAWMRGELGL